jgi:uncharacterized protein
VLKTAKVHFVDSGLCAALADLAASDWMDERQRFGHLLESFVLEQLVAQAAWTDPDLRFWHYRDKEKNEVDVVLTRGRSVWGVEVKASATIDHRAARGLVKLAEQCGDEFAMGIVLYAGRDILRLGDARMLAVPISLLWRM